MSQLSQLTLQARLRTQKSRLKIWVIAHLGPHYSHKLRYNRPVTAMVAGSGTPKIRLVFGVQHGVLSPNPRTTRCTPPPGLDMGNLTQNEANEAVAFLVRRLDSIECAAGRTGTTPEMLARMARQARLDFQRGIESHRYLQQAAA